VRGMVTPGTTEKRKAQTPKLAQARQMRHAPVSMEKLFWSMVRNRQLGGFKFKRQVPIGPYIADFVCLEAKLIVELDGPFHDARKVYDAKRDAYLTERGFRVVRLTNDYFAGDASTALLIVDRALRSGTPSP